MNKYFIKKKNQKVKDKNRVKVKLEGEMLFIKDDKNEEKVKKQ